MIVCCNKCQLRFDDEFRTTICPHETFAANDGRNNFKHYPDATIFKYSEENCPGHVAWSRDHRRCGRCGVTTDELR